MRVLGVIPARGGSKGIPGKNLRPFRGRPLIWWTIAAARQSQRLDTVVVSTDDQEIAAACRSWGEYVLDRPAELATDESPVIDTVLHALADRTWQPHAVMLLQPTNPLRNASDIDAAIALLENYPKADSVCAVYRPDSHPYRMRTIDGNGFLQPLCPGVPELRRQRLPYIPERDGSIYLVRTETLRTLQRFEGDACLPLIIPEERSLRLDTERDWMIGEMMAAKLLQLAAE